jgi:hypothetical protein
MRGILQLAQFESEHLVRDRRVAISFMNFQHYGGDWDVGWIPDIHAKIFGKSLKFHHQFCSLQYQPPAAASYKILAS